MKRFCTVETNHHNGLPAILYAIGSYSVDSVFLVIAEGKGVVMLDRAMLDKDRTFLTLDYLIAMYPL